MESAAVRTLHFAYVLSAILLIAGCDGPVRIGIEAARAARVAPNPTNEAGSPEINRPGLIHRVAFAPARAGSGNIIAPPVPQPADPSQIVGLILQNNSDKPMPARAVQFGQVFVPGQSTRNGKHRRRQQRGKAADAVGRQDDQCRRFHPVRRDHRHCAGTGSRCLAGTDADTNRSRFISGHSAGAFG